MRAAELFKDVAPFCFRTLYSSRTAKCLINQSWNEHFITTLPGVQTHDRMTTRKACYCLNLSATKSLLLFFILPFFLNLPLMISFSNLLTLFFLSFSSFIQTCWTNAIKKMYSDLFLTEENCVAEMFFFFQCCLTFFKPQCGFLAFIQVES